MWNTPGADLARVESGVVDFAKGLFEDPREITAMKREAGVSPRLLAAYNSRRVRRQMMK